MKQKIKILTLNLLVLIFAVSCNSNQETTNLTKQNIQESDSTNTIVIQEETPELIKIEQFLINNQVNWKSTIEELKNNIQIDSIVPLPEYMELSDADNLIYIGKTYFQYYKELNYCELGILVFDDKVKEVDLNGIKLSNNTTPEILATYFSDCKSTEEINIYNDEAIYEICTVGIANVDMYLSFLFIKDRLKRIDVFYPS